jgi:hypothetical protein
MSSSVVHVSRACNSLVRLELGEPRRESSEPAGYAGTDRYGREAADPPETSADVARPPETDSRAPRQCRIGMRPTRLSPYVGR